MAERRTRARRSPGPFAAGRTIDSYLSLRSWGHEAEEVNHTPQHIVGYKGHVPTFWAPKLTRFRELKRAESLPAAWGQSHQDSFLSTTAQSGFGLKSDPSCRRGLP